MDQSEKVRDWMYQAETKFQIIKFTQKRETAVIVPKDLAKNTKYPTIRWLRTHTVDHLDYIINKIVKYYNKPYQFYYSMARYKEGIPKGVQGNFGQEWKKNLHEYVITYDWLIDIDSDSHATMELAQLSAINICQFLDKYNTPYEIRFSGCGFHIIIDGINMLDLNLSFNPHIKGNIYDLYSKLNKYLYNSFSHFVDTGISDSKRLCKLPYTLAVYDDKTYVCMPLNFEQLQNFRLNTFTSDAWIGRIRFRPATYIHNTDKQFKLTELLIDTGCYDEVKEWQKGLQQKKMLKD